jgi:hypothetical protein
MPTAPQRLNSIRHEPYAFSSTSISSTASLPLPYPHAIAPQIHPEDLVVVRDLALLNAGASAKFLIQYIHRKYIRTWNIISPASNKHGDDCDERRYEAKGQGYRVAGGNYNSKSLDEAEGLCGTNAFRMA